MNVEQALPFLQDPAGGGSLRIEDEGNRAALVSDSGARYPLESGIARFLTDVPLTGDNGRYQHLYDRLAPLYDTITSTYALFREGGEKKRVTQYLSTLDVKDGDAVVEIGIGTGRNIKYMNPRARYFGLDISMGMLERCRRSLARRRDIFLVQAQAECTPFADESFDVVFSAGGFNFFNDKRQAVLEMLRIAKFGTKLMISDETQKIVERFDSADVAGNFYKDQAVIHPAEFVPSTCRDLEYREICKGELYALTFVKP